MVRWGVIGKFYNLSETGEQILVALGTPPLANNYRVNGYGSRGALDASSLGSTPSTLTNSLSTGKMYNYVVTLYK